MAPRDGSAAEPSSIELLQSALAGLYTPRRLAVALAVSAGLFLLLVNSSWRIAPDSALYMSLGRSIADDGAYRFNGQPHALVPPGYPAMLAGLRCVFGDGFMGPRAVHALMGWLCGVLVFLAVRRMYGNDIAFAVMLLFIVSHSLFKRSAYFLSDVPFALATWAAIYLAVRASSAARLRWLWALAAGAALATVPLIRINGWGLLPAVAVALAVAWRGQGWRRWGWLALVVAAGAAAPAAWQAWAAAAEVPGKVTYVGAIMDRGAEFLRVYADCLLGYPQETAVAMLGLPDIPTVVAIVLLVPIAVGLVIFLRRGHLLLPLVVLVQYAGLSLSTPGERYLIPLLPALYLFGLVGLLAIVRALSPRSRRWRPAVVIGSVMLVLIAVNIGRDGKAIWQARTAVPGGAETADMQYWFTACDWLRSHPGAGGGPPVVLCRQVGIVSYLAGARGVFSGSVVKDGLGSERPEYILMDRGSMEGDADRDAVDLADVCAVVEQAGGRIELKSDAADIAPLEILGVAWPAAPSRTPDE